ncbi:unnamed protein product [Darwinula stevensoni]|uniref:Uncharacterized protein n=1 Tax=Darwinula stevensoni TaxID=69355 RepID=A0A7R9A2S4_9CRUS|nr:unnamed protein product [Darwinula stevensoni]CAG0890282.1 unnamed protein product [Darwinula stevensoni]
MSNVLFPTGLCLPEGTNIYCQIMDFFDADDYESLPTNSMTAYMVAGSCAGIMEHCIMYPVDSVKTRMQSLCPVTGARHIGIYGTISSMVRYEGLFRPFRGMSAVVVGAGPAHAMFFSSYEVLKNYFSVSGKVKSDHTAHALAGCCATLLHDSLMVPAEAVKQRMQMYGSPYRHVLDCTIKMFQAEGILAFYRSFTTQVLMNIPFHSTHFTVYELMQNVTNWERDYNPAAHMLSGAMAGATAAAFTTPLDVCKTLLNTQEAQALQKLHKTHIHGIFNALRTVYTLRGIPGYFQGMQARVLFQMPATAISWSIYEFFKHLFAKRDSQRESLYEPVVLSADKSSKIVGKRIK